MQDFSKLVFLRQSRGFLTHSQNMVKYGRLSPRITVGNRLGIELDEREATCPTNRSSVRPTDHPSNRESVRPTVRPVLLRRKANIVLSATTSTPFIATTKVAAVGRYHKRGGGACSRASGFLCSYSTQYLLYTSVRLELDGLSVGRTLD